MFKIILSIIGLWLIRPAIIGGLVGYFVGWLIDSSLRGKTKPRYRYSSRVNYESRYGSDFRVKLLVLSATVIRADGKVQVSERNFVREFFVKQYGRDETNRIFREYNGNPRYQTMDVGTAARDISYGTQYQLRTSVVHFLFSIAESDGSVTPAELEKIRQIATALRISEMDFDSIRAMFVKVVDPYYTILEISSDASDQEVKQAYRKMAKKYHPDRVLTDDPAMMDRAKSKFQQIQKAYEEIKNIRGL